MAELPQLVASPDQLAGRYANKVAVHRDWDEFTVDFLREDASTGKFILVSRVTLPPTAVHKLIEALDKLVSEYAKEAARRGLIPKDVNDDDGQSAGG